MAVHNIKMSCKNLTDNWNPVIVVRELFTRPLSLLKTAQTQIHDGVEACVRSSEVISTIDLKGIPLKKPWCLAHSSSRASMILWRPTFGWRFRTSTNDRKQTNFEHKLSKKPATCTYSMWWTVGYTFSSQSTPCGFSFIGFWGAVGLITDQFRISWAKPTEPHQLDSVALKGTPI